MDIRSSFQNALPGASQGYILLDPLLLNVCINHIENIDDQQQFITYAGDTSLFLSGDVSETLICKTNII